MGVMDIESNNYHCGYCVTLTRRDFEKATEDQRKSAEKSEKEVNDIGINGGIVGLLTLGNLLFNAITKAGVGG